MKENKTHIYDYPLMVQVAKTLIDGHFDSWQIPFTVSTSPRNGLYRLQRLWGVKMYQIKKRTSKGKEYTEYRIPNIRTMEKAINYFELKAWKLPDNVKATALTRTRLLEQKIAKELQDQIQSLAILKDKKIP